MNSGEGEGGTSRRLLSMSQAGAQGTRAEVSVLVRGRKREVSVAHCNPGPGTLAQPYHSSPEATYLMIRHRPLPTSFVHPFLLLFLASNPPFKLGHKRGHLA